jgi:hypothetical protein
MVYTLASAMSDHRRPSCHRYLLATGRLFPVLAQVA